MGTETEQDQIFQAIERCFDLAAGTWVGCDWPTEFGSACLNLERLTSAQAILMARATAGKEEAAWWEASRWLARVEQEAREAEHEARRAVHAAGINQWVAALAHARTACDIESRYHRQLVWRPLREAVEKGLKASPSV